MKLLITITLLSVVNAATLGVDCKIDYCLNCTADSTRCFTCATNYYVDPADGKCKFQETYNTVNYRMCDRPTDAYDSVQKKCVYVSGCSEYNTEDESMAAYCESCYPDHMKYSMKPSYCDDWRTKYLPHCAKIWSGKTCRACDPGYYVDSSSNCSLDPYANDKWGCKMGYFMDLYKGGNNPYKCVASTVKNCLTYGSISQCLKCNVGFYVSNGNCVAHSLDNCLETADGKTCTQCLKGYGLNEMATCAKCTNTTCDLCKTTTTCSKCSPQYGEAKDANGNIICVPKIEGCWTYAVGGATCKTCDDYHVLENGKCRNCNFNDCETITGNKNNMMKCGNFCSDEDLKSTSNKLSKLSQRPHKRNFFGKEVNAGCNYGYYLTKDLTCKPCDAKCNGFCRENSWNCYYPSRYIEGCDIYATNGSKCISCKTNYQLIGETGYCEKKPIGCYAYSPEGKCIECYHNYDVVFSTTTGKCNAVPSNAYSSGCPTGWTKSSNQCVYSCTGVGEASVNNENNGCICKTGYALFNNKCTFQCGEHQVANAANTGCVCERNYEMKNGKCQLKCDTAAGFVLNSDSTACECKGNNIIGEDGTCSVSCGAHKTANPDSTLCVCEEDYFENVEGDCEKAPEYIDNHASMLSILLVIAMIVLLF